MKYNGRKRREWNPGIPKSLWTFVKAVYRPNAGKKDLVI